MTNRAEALAKALQGLLAYFPNGATFERMGFDPKPTVEAYKAARAALEAYRSQPDGWRPISEIPEQGQFLVYMPEEERAPVQVAQWRPNVKVIGGLFSFDCKPITHFMELPAPPNSKEQQ